MPPKITGKKRTHREAWSRTDKQSLVSLYNQNKRHRPDAAFANYRAVIPLPNLVYFNAAQGIYDSHRKPLRLSFDAALSFNDWSTIRYMLDQYYPLEEGPMPEFIEEFTKDEQIVMAALRGRDDAPDLPNEVDDTDYFCGALNIAVWHDLEDVVYQLFQYRDSETIKAELDKLDSKQIKPVLIYNLESQFPSKLQTILPQLNDDDFCQLCKSALRQYALKYHDFETADGLQCELEERGDTAFDQNLFTYHPGAAVQWLIQKDEVDGQTIQDLMASHPDLNIRECLKDAFENLINAEECRHASKVLALLGEDVETFVFSHSQAHDDSHQDDGFNIQYDDAVILRLLALLIYQNNAQANLNYPQTNACLANPIYRFGIACQVLESCDEDLFTKLLQRRHFDINERKLADQSNDTLLHHMARRNNVGAVDMLKRHGADLQAVNNNNQKPVDVVEETGHRRCNLLRSMLNTRVSVQNGELFNNTARSLFSEGIFSNRGCSNSQSYDEFEALVTGYDNRDFTK